MYDEVRKLIIRRNPGGKNMLLICVSFPTFSCCWVVQKPQQSLRPHKHYLGLYFAVFSPSLTLIVQLVQIKDFLLVPTFSPIIQKYRCTEIDGKDCLDSSRKLESINLRRFSPCDRSLASSGATVQVFKSLKGTLMNLVFGLPWD